MARVLITGAGGFVGPYLISECRKEGWKVFGTSFPDATTEADVSLPLDVTDAAAVHRAVSEVRPDFVCHLAGFSSVRESWKHPERCRAVNVDGTRNLLDSLRAAAPAARILIISSAEVYGIPSRLPIREEDPLAPRNPYGNSRKEQEEMLRSYADLHIVVSRSFNHIGPSQPKGFVIPDFCSQIVAIERGASPRILTGDISVRRDFTDVRDVVRAYVALLKRGEAGTAYNVCSGTAPSLTEILSLLISLSTRRGIETAQDPDLIRPVEIPELRGSNEKVECELGWRPEIPLEESLKEILGHWRKEL